MNNSEINQEIVADLTPSMKYHDSHKKVTYSVENYDKEGNYQGTVWVIAGSAKLQKDGKGWTVYINKHNPKGRYSIR